MVEESSKSSPDGYKVFSALCSIRVECCSESDSEKVLQSLTSLLAAKGGILGWPQDSPYFCWPGVPARDGDEEYDDE